MSSRLANIETKMVSLLESVDGSNQGSYTYNSTTGQVQVYDEVLSISRNTDTKFVNHYIEQQEDVGVENTEYQVGQYAYNQRVIYEIKSKVHNIGDENNAKNAIRTKMNELLDDLLYLFGNNYTLNGQATKIQFNNAYRDYSDVSNNRIQSGELVTTWTVEYTQSIADPSQKACA